MIAVSALVLSLAVSAFAAPSKRQASQDNGACKALQSTCAASVKSDLSDAWNIKACVFGATCFGGQHPVDGFLAAVYSQKGGKGAAPASVSLPRVTSSLFNAISSDHKTLSQQNFIDGFYSSLDASNGPYPTSVSIVESYYQRVAVWTAYCSSSVPLQNFADYFQYSATVNSNGCSGSITSAFISSVTPGATTFASAGTAVTSVISDSFTTAITQSTIVTARPTGTSQPITTSRPAATASSSVIVPIGTTTVSSALPAITTRVISSDATCQKMLTICIAQTDQGVTNPWSVEACVLGASCYDHSTTSTFADAAFAAKNRPAGSYPQYYPDDIELPRLSASLFAKISTDGKTLTQQNFIDAYYSTLSSVGGPYPPNTDQVVSYYNRIREWTAFCPGTGIPYMNVADYLQFQETVPGGTAQC